LRSLPPATQPPEIINSSASSVPVLQLGVSGPGLSEQQLNDLSLNFLWTQLITVPGAVIPLPYGGKPRQVMINLDQNLMQAKNVSLSDVLNSVNAQNLILPSGTAKIAGGVDKYLQVVTSQTTASTNERNDIDILRRRLDANVLLIKAMGGGWDVSQLHQS
jgi:multidrug efflux pump subunit AcrB